MIEYQPRRGLMLVISSPSGAGKTSLSRRLLVDHPELALDAADAALLLAKADGRGRWRSLSGLGPEG